MILEIVFRTVLAMLLLSGSIVLGIHFTKDDPTEVLFPVVLYTKKTMFRLDFHFRRAIEIQTYVSIQKRTERCIAYMEAL